MIRLYLPLAARVLFCAILFLLLAFRADVGATESFTVQGTVVDETTGQPVHLANVRLIDSHWATTTDPEGRFEIQSVSAGIYTLVVSRVGYGTFALESLRVEGAPETPLRVFLSPVVQELKEITVTPGSFTFMEGAEPASQIMTRRDIESVPQFGEDLFRAVNRLPGLSSGDISAHFSIRGGRHEETLILFDGLELYEPYHMKEFNEGALSILDLQTIEGVELMTGGFSAEYGNKTSGVFSIKSREPRGDGTRASVGFSLMNLRGHAEGRFAEGDGSWIVSARRGYLDLVFTLMNQNDIPSPVYYDIFSKVRYQVNPRNTIALNLLHARDTYSFDVAGTTGFQDTIKTHEWGNNRYGNSYAWFTHTGVLGEGAAVQTLGSVGLIRRNRGGTEFYTDTADAIYEVADRRDLTVLGLKQDWSFDATSKFFIESGFDFRRFDVDYTINNKVWRDPDDPSPDPLAFFPVETTRGQKKNGTTFAAYATGRMRPVDPLTFSIGTRYDRASYVGESHLSPRLNARVDLTSNTNLKLGWGHYRQFQGLEQIDALDNRGRYYPAELSKQWTAGVEHAFEDGSKLRVEGYFKRGSSLRPIFRNWKAPKDVFPESDDDYILVYPDRSTSKGAEVYFERNLGSRLALRTGYALSFVEETVSRIDNINDDHRLVFDRTHAAPQDQRHALNADLSWQVSNAWSISLSYAYHSGWPSTLERMVQIEQDGRTDFAIKAEKLYGARFPNYQRLDARATRRVRTSWGDLRFFVELVNMTNHSNVWGYDYFRMPSNAGDVRLQRDLETWFTILPSLGISWSGDL